MELQKEARRWKKKVILDRLSSTGLLTAPKWLTSNCAYLTIMGSDAFGISDGVSDLDIYGFCVPPKYLVFPHLNGEIAGFGQKTEPFNQWQQHHIKSPDRDIEYDFTVYGIVRYMQLCMDNNPNVIDSLFSPRRCVLHSTAIAEHIRERRKELLHKGAWIKI
jgi:predicted nucleotidyltransferase